MTIPISPAFSNAPSDKVHPSFSANAYRYALSEGVVTSESVVTSEGVLIGESALTNEGVVSVATNNFIKKAQAYQSKAQTL